MIQAMKSVQDKSRAKQMFIFSKRSEMNYLSKMDFERSGLSSLDLQEIGVA